MIAMDPTTRAAFLDELMKIAEVDQATDSQSAVQPDRQLPPDIEEQKEIDAKKEHPAMSALKGIGGFALGAGLGYGAGHLTNQAVKYFNNGEGIPPAALHIAAPIVGGGAGLGFMYLQHKMMDKMRQVQEAKEGDAPSERVNQSSGT